MPIAITKTIELSPIALATIACRAKRAKSDAEADRKEACRELLDGSWDRHAIAVDQHNSASYRGEKSTPGGVDTKAAEVLMTIAADALAELACVRHAALIATLRAGCPRKGDKTSVECVVLVTS